MIGETCGVESGEECGEEESTALVSRWQRIQCVTKETIGKGGSMRAEG